MKKPKTQEKLKNFQLSTFNFQLRRFLLTLALALAGTTLMAQITYIVTNGSPTSTYNCSQVSMTNQPLQNVINSIRVNAAGANCTIQFGTNNSSNYAVLSWGSAIFDGSLTTPKWGTVTITGWAYGGNNGGNTDLFIVQNGASVIFNARIAHSAGLADYGNLIVNTSGTVTISGNEIKATYGTAIKNTDGYTLLWNNADVSSDKSVAIINDGSGEVFISNAYVSSNTKPAIALYDGKITNQGGLISSAGTHSHGVVWISTNSTSSSATLFEMQDGAEVKSTTNCPAIYSEGSGSIKITGGTVTNSSANGTAISNHSFGTIDIKGGSISALGGQAVYNNSGVLNISGGTLTSQTNNVVDHSGGMKVTISGNVYLASANTATDGGTVYIFSGSLEMRGGTVRNTNINTDARGNAIYLDSNSGNSIFSDGKVEGGINNAIVAKGNAKLTISAYANITSENIENITYGNGTIKLSSNISAAQLTMTGGTITNNVGIGIRTESITGNYAGISISGGYISTREEAILNYGYGTINISGGTVTSSSKNAIYNVGEGAVNISGGRLAAVNQPAIVNNMSGKITISGTAFVTSANSYTTGTFLGTICLRSYSSATTTRLDIKGGTVQNTSSGGYTIYNESAGPVEFSNSSSIIFPGVIAGTGPVIKTGTGFLYLTGNNLYTGNTTVEQGYLQIGNNTTTGSIAGNVRLNNTGGIGFYRSNPYTYNGVISGAGTGKVGVSGPGTITLGGVNTFTSGMEIYGTLVLSATGSIAESYGVDFDGGVLDISAGNKTIKRISSLASEDGSKINLGSRVLTIGNSGQSDGGGNWDGIFTGTGGGVEKKGSETLSIRYNNTATDYFTLREGTLNFSGTWPGPFYQAAGTTFTVNGNAAIGGSLYLNGGAINMNLSGATPSRISATGACTATGTTTINISPSAAPSNQVLISAASGLGNIANFKLNNTGQPLSTLTATGTQLQLTGTASSFVPVTGITGVPAIAIVGTPLTLSGTVTPSNATNKTIVWSVFTAGSTGATITGSTLTATAAGTVTVRATITNGTAVGTNYTQVFPIIVSTTAPLPLFDGLANSYGISGHPAVTLKVKGKGSETLTVFKVNGANATVFNPATVGKYLIEASSPNGKLKIWKYVRVVNDL